MRIAILAGTSHLARALTPYFLAAGDDLTLFARRPDALAGTPARVESDFDRLGDAQYDLLLNCVGAGTPAVLGTHYERWFAAPGEFDDRALDYLRKVNPEALYVHFSSGAVYDRTRTVPTDDGAARTFYPNALTPPDFYALSKLYAEAKHRAFPELRIVDLRIFSFFSRHAALDSGYLMTDLVCALADGAVLRTGAGDLSRDYPHPADLHALIQRCARLPELNAAFDVYSAAPVKKSEIIEYFINQYGLRVEYESSRTESPNGAADVYFSTSRRAQKITGWTPHYRSLQTLAEETAVILQQKGMRHG